MNHGSKMSVSEWWGTPSGNGAAGGRRAGGGRSLSMTQRLANGRSASAGSSTSLESERSASGSSPTFGGLTRSAHWLRNRSIGAGPSAARSASTSARSEASERSRRSAKTAGRVASLMYEATCIGPPTPVMSSGGSSGPGSSLSRTAKCTAYATSLGRPAGADEVTAQRHGGPEGRHRYPASGGGTAPAKWIRMVAMPSSVWTSRMAARSAIASGCCRMVRSKSSAL